MGQCHIYQKVGTAYPNSWTIVCSFMGHQMLRKVLDLKTCEHEPILVYAFGQSEKSDGLPLNHLFDGLQKRSSTQ